MNYLGNSRKEKRKKKNKVIQVVIIIIAIIVSIYLLASMNLPILSNISGAVVNRSECSRKYSKGNCQRWYKLF